MKALIIGGGIGGLATALALRQVGVESVVFERTAEIREVGAGLALWSGTMHLLRRLGIADQVIANGGPLRRSVLRNWRGDVLSEVDASELIAASGEPSVCLPRSDLLRALYAALPAEIVQTNARCIGFQIGTTGVTARFGDGREECGDMLIGADGLHSVVRDQLLGKRPASYAGYTCWRGIAALDTPQIANMLSESWGRGERFGIGDIGNGRVLWFATANAPEGQQESSPAARKADLLSRYKTWHLPIVAALEATPAEAILRNDVYDRPPASLWGQGPVTLLGDAAHPTTPNLGMGACEAIEDALVLAGRLQRRGDVARALRAYETARQGRTAQITRFSRAFGWLAQWSNPVACQLRDRMLQLTPSSVTRRQFQAVIDFTVESQ